MISTDWPTTNAEAIAAALHWLRDRLKTLSTPAPSPPSPTPPIPTLTSLGDRLGLSHFERSLLWLCVATELDPQMGEHYARAQGNSSRPYPTFSLAFRCFAEPSWEALSPQRPLRYWQLLEINQPPAQPLTTSALRADERITNYIKGLNELDDRFSALLLPMQTAAFRGELPPSQQAGVEAIAQFLQALDLYEPLPPLQLVGADSLSKQLIAQQTCELLDLRLYRLPIEQLPTQPADLELLARLWQRESLLLPMALYLDGHDAEEHLTKGAASPVNRFLSQSRGLFFCSSRDSQQMPGQDGFCLDVEKPTPAEQKRLWAIALNDSTSALPTQLASQFNLSAVAISAIAQRSAASSETLWSNCLIHTRPQLDTLAQRIDTKATWTDLILPAEATNLLKQIADQVRQRHQVYEEWGFHRKLNRGMGINALFAGESGTGKTMAAEVIANDLKLNLYRIDLSAVVSKYIGETEKNLRRLFDAAEDGGAILLFDEADALFGKRSEVKDSHDRYANIEINYLLQRMEAYRGLAILATNMKNALDTAFLRRLRFIVNFPFPSLRERIRLWQQAFPPETPTTGLDCDRLATLNLTGGNIHTVAINAAFLAAQAGTPVTMPLVLAAARTEYRKLDRPINELDFQ
ncbi:MAG TPA: ATP-binding protein [Synechococcales cyanobacterium M55_K2018_004]|nr:ATP-binding protein [Synechococcales cyanobacterium M55_K2018_004]